MAKLIYSQAKYADVCADGKLLDQALKAENKNNYYRSILITDDGYFVTHGKAFKMVDVKSQTINVTLTESNGTLTITDTLTTASTNVKLPVWKLTQGNGITVTNGTGANIGNWEIKQTTPVKGDQDSTFGVTYNSNAGTISFGSGTYDSLGRITSYTAATSSQHIDHVKQSIEEANLFYLLGSTVNTASTGETVKNTGVYISFDGITPQLNVAKLKVGGINNILIGNGANDNLGTYIANEVDKAKTQALVYQGTITPPAGTTESSPYVLEITGVTNGDVYKVIGSGYIQLKNGSVKFVKSGDLLIAKAESGVFKEWDFVPSGDEEETFIKFGTDTLSGTITFDGNGVSYNSTSKTFTFNDTTYEAFKGATSSAAGKAGLVPAPTSSQVNYYLSGSGNWKALPTINNGKLTLKIGDDIIIGNNFTANGTDKTYVLNYATQVDTTITSGVVKGKAVNINPTTSGWTYAKVVDGEIQFYNNVVTYTQNTFERTLLTIGKVTVNGTETNVQVPYAGAATTIDGVLHTTPGIIFTNSTVTDATNYIASPIINGAVYYQNTWRPIYAYKPTASNGIEITNIWKSSNGTSALEFSSDFIAVNADSTRTGEEIHLTWAEISADGTTITYAY